MRLHVPHLHHQSPIKLIDDEYDRFMSDKLKFDNFIEKHREKVDNLNHRIEGVRGAIAELGE